MLSVSSPLGRKEVAQRFERWVAGTERQASPDRDERILWEKVGGHDETTNERQDQLRFFPSNHHPRPRDYLSMNRELLHDQSSLDSVR